MVAERRPHEPADRVVVLDEENRLRPEILRDHRRSRLEGLARRLVDGRQVHAEGRPGPGLTRESDVSTGPLHDVVNRGEAEARPSSELLGREKRFEEVRLDRLGHALSAVGDREKHVATRGNAGVTRRGDRVDGDAARADVQLTAARHGVAGVHHEIEQKLLDLSLVDPDASRRLDQLKLELHVLAEDAPNHLLGPVDVSTEVHEPRIAPLPPPEGEELAGDEGGTLRGIRDLPKTLVHRVVRVHLVLQELGRTENDAQHIVEVVRDTAGQPADGLESLRLGELLLQALLLSQIRNARAHERPVVRGKARHAYLARNVISLRIPSDPLELLGLPVEDLLEVRHRLGQGLRAVRLARRAEIAGAHREQGLAAVSEELHGLVIDVEDGAARGIEDDDCLGCVVEDRVKALFAPPELFGGDDPISDVPRHDDRTRRVRVNVRLVPERQRSNRGHDGRPRCACDDRKQRFAKRRARAVGNELPRSAPEELRGRSSERTSRGGVHVEQTRLAIVNRHRIAQAIQDVPLVQLEQPRPLHPRHGAYAFGAEKDGDESRQPLARRRRRLSEWL